MTTHPETIDAYIAALPDEVQAMVEALRVAIREAVPDIVEAIKYGMPAFRLKDTYVIYLAAWKKHIGLYPVARNLPFEDEITPYRAEKDTLQLRYQDPLPLDLVARIVAARAAELRLRAPKPPARAKQATAGS